MCFSVHLGGASGLMLALAAPARVGPRTRSAWPGLQGKGKRATAGAFDVPSSLFKHAYLTELTDISFLLSKISDSLQLPYLSKTTQHLHDRHAGPQLSSAFTTSSRDIPSPVFNSDGYSAGSCFAISQYPPLEPEYCQPPSFAFYVITCFDRFTTFRNSSRRAWCWAWTWTDKTSSSVDRRRTSPPT